MVENKSLLKQGSALLFTALMATAMELPVDNSLTSDVDHYIVHNYAKDNILLGDKFYLKGCSPQAEAIYNRAIASEPAITRAMISIRNKLKLDFYNLGNNIKQVDSVVAKLDRLRKADEAIGKAKPDYVYLASLGDLVRYTFMCEHAKLASETKAIIKELEARSITIDEIDNKYLRKDILYKAIHINATAPSGQKFEIQIHSPESMYCNVFTHKLYEEARSTATSDVDRALSKEKIKLAYSTLPMPKDIETITNV